MLLALVKLFKVCVTFALLFVEIKLHHSPFRSCMHPELEFAIYWLGTSLRTLFRSLLALLSGSNLFLRGSIFLPVELCRRLTFLKPHFGRDSFSQRDGCRTLIFKIKVHEQVVHLFILYFGGIHDSLVVLHSNYFVPQYLSICLQGVISLLLRTFYLGVPFWL